MSRSRIQSPGLAAALVLLLALALGAARPDALETIALTHVGTIPGPADLVRVYGNHAYVVAEKTLTAFDVADPAAPGKAGSYTFPEKIWGFRVVDSLAYVAADFYGLGILDVSDPAAITLRGALKTPGQAKNVAIVGVSAGSFAYAVDSPSGLYVFDLSKQGPLEPVATDQSASGTRLIELAEDPAGRKRLALMPGGGGQLQIYDISDAEAPVKLSAFKMPGQALRVAVSGSLAYVADGREGLHIVDLSDPVQPKIVGKHQTPAPARDVAVRDDLVFVVVGALPRGNVHEGGGEVLILRRQ
jgi:hypothetical protein